MVVNNVEQIGILAPYEVIDPEIDQKIAYDSNLALLRIRIDLISPLQIPIVKIFCKTPLSLIRKPTINALT